MWNKSNEKCKLLIFFLETRLLLDEHFCLNKLELFISHVCTILYLKNHKKETVRQCKAHSRVMQVREPKVTSSFVTQNFIPTKNVSEIILIPCRNACAGSVVDSCEMSRFKNPKENVTPMQSP